jgi:LPXTG-motif cell wall-anchored protein
MEKANFNANDVVIEIFKDAACTEANKVATWREDDATPKFVVDYDPPVETGENAPTADASRMQITMTAAGLDEINHSTAVYDTAATGQSGELHKGYSDCYMRITYSATINQDADVVYGDNGNPNTVTLDWQRSNMNYIDQLTDDCHVYTYGLDLTKQFSDNNGDFSKVQFKVFNKTDGYWVTAVESPAGSGIYYVKGLDDFAQDPTATPAGWVAGYSDDDLSTGVVSATDEDGSLGTTFIPNATSGVFKIYGLEDDEYIITEVQTDNGYTLLKENINVKIVAAEDENRPCDIYTVDENGVWQNKFTGEIYNGTPYDQDELAHVMLTASATVDDSATAMEADNGSADALVPLTVINTKGFDLPKTGAEGTWMLSIMGIVGMATVAGVIMMVTKRKREEDDI